MRNILFTVLLLFLFVHGKTQTNIPVGKNNKSGAFDATDSLKQKLQQPTKEEMAKTKAANTERAAKTQFLYFIIKADGAGYGYSIYADGNLYLQQNTIPAMPGNKGFADTATAGKCAQLVIQKIKKGQIPPTLTVEELKKNNLITNN